jgi:putative tricarboxylic transport membrane protein
MGVVVSSQFKDSRRQKGLAKKGDWLYFRTATRRGIVMTIDRFSGAFLVLVGLIVVWERRVLPLGTTHHPGPGYVPLLLAILLILLGAILFIRGKGSAALGSLGWPEAPHAIAILGCCVAVTVLMEWIGYRLTLLIVLGFLFGIVERINLWLTLLLTAGLSLGTFWLFDTFLRVPLPRGGWGF